MPRAAATTRAYAADWSEFCAWCDAHGLTSLPASPTTVAAYVDELAAHRRVSTVRRRVAAVRARHVDAGVPSPTSTLDVQAALTRAEWRGRHDRTTTRPLGVDELRAVSRAAPATMAGRRDRALVLVGYGAGLAPGELARLGVDDIAVGPAGIDVRTARGRSLVPYGSDDWLCSVAAWRAWRQAAHLRQGPAFRPVDRHGVVHDRPLGVRGVTRIVQRAAARAGLDPARYSGRSLRRGMVLAATEHGASERGIMAQTGHRSRRLVRRYMSEVETPLT
jgi:site-specific recombinase XerD